MNEHDLLAIIKFRNLALHRAIPPVGGIKELAHQIGVSYGHLLALLSLRCTPFSKRKWEGEYKPTVVKISKFLGYTPQELFPATLYALQLSKVERTFQSERILSLRQAAAQNLLPETTTELGLNVIQKECRDALSESIESLPTKREQEVINLRFGLDGGKEHNLGELGCKMGLSRERVRQVEARALRNLRHPSRSSRLAPFIEPKRKPQPEEKPKLTYIMSDAFCTKCKVAYNLKEISGLRCLSCDGRLLIWDKPRAKPEYCTNCKHRKDFHNLTCFARPNGVACPCNGFIGWKGIGYYGEKT